MPEPDDQPVGLAAALAAEQAHASRAGAAAGYSPSLGFLGGGLALGSASSPGLGLGLGLAVLADQLGLLLDLLGLLDLGRHDDRGDDRLLGVVEELDALGRG